MRSSVAVYVAFILPITLTLAIPLSKPDASPSTQRLEERDEHQNFIRRMLYVDSIASDLEPKEKRDPSPTTAALDYAPTASSSALDTPFAATHHMGHGPAVSPLTTSTPHGDNRNHTYQPVKSSENATHYAHGNGTEQRYQCDPSLPAENLTAILMSGRPQDDPGCRLVVNKTAYANATSSVPEQNKNNPAYIGGGEAAAPPGYHATPDNMTTSIPAGENSTPIEIKVKQYSNGTETTTATVTEQMNGEQAGSEMSGTSGSDVGGSAMGNSSTGTNTLDNPPTTDAGGMPTSTEAAAPAGMGKGKTPYALPPGFTGP